VQANLYEFQKYNRDSGEAPYFNCSRLQRIATQVLRSLAFMHSLSLLHCDLKPENILIRSYSRCLVKVIDVGSSCFMTDHLSSYVQSRSYRAPEVILGLPYDARIDIWSLGCILAELYSGYVLFQNDSLATLLARCVGILGPMPARMRQGRHAHKYFTRSGDIYERDDDAGRAFLLRPKRCSLRHRLRGADAGFVDFVAWLLTLDSEARPTAAQALTHPWLQLAYPPDEEAPV
jgi:serine/threonine protein kinase